MKKLFIYASVVGLAAGAIYLLCKKKKFDNTESKPIDKKVDLESRLQKQKDFQNSKIMDEMYKSKSESVQDIYERHLEASEIMKDSYRNIMEDFVEDFSGEEVVNKETETKEIVIDSESVSVMKEINSISDEIDNLLK